MNLGLFTIYLVSPRFHMTYATVMASEFGKCVPILRTDPLALAGQSSQSQICVTLLKIYVHKGVCMLSKTRETTFYIKIIKTCVSLEKQTQNYISINFTPPVKA